MAALLGPALRQRGAGDVVSRSNCRGQPLGGGHASWYEYCSGDAYMLLLAKNKNNVFLISLVVDCDQ